MPWTLCLIGMFNATTYVSPSIPKRRASRQRGDKPGLNQESHPESIKKKKAEIKLAQHHSHTPGIPQDSPLSAGAAET